MPLNLDFILANIQTNNESSSREFFENRFFYKSAAFSDIGIATIDTWEERPFYGLLDLQHFPIHLEKMEFLSDIDDSDIECQDFVADAFDAMRRYWNDLKTHGRLSEDSELLDLQPERGWESINDLHEEYVGALMSVFNDVYMPSDDRISKIRNFDDFITHFKRYLKNLSGTPFTKSSLILSRSAPLAGSGLIVEVSDQDYDDDIVKYNSFVNDPNFEIFLIVARKYGFRADRNIPWRLIADIGSKEMQEFMLLRGVMGGPAKKMISSLFKERFSRAYTGEIEMLKDILIESYNTFVDLNPVFKISEAQRCNGHSAVTTRTTIVKRQQLTDAELQKRYNDQYWLNLYADIRNYETGRFKNEKEIKYFKKQINIFINKQKKDVDISNALLYTEKTMRLCPRYSYEMKKPLTEEEIAKLELEFLSAPIQ